MKKLLMTGGGTAGHVTPNIALINALRNKYEIHYIGSKNSIEEELIKDINIPFYGISSGKLRRSLNFKNFTDFFKVSKGYFDALKVLNTVKPDLVFSKGGFVIVPVVLASASKRIPIIIHESDITIGLANKISIPYAKKVCLTFEKTFLSLKSDKKILTGTPIRTEIFTGDKNKGLDICNFKNVKPILLMQGGSLGSVQLNSLLRNNISNLDNFNIIHLCGKNNLDTTLNFDNYVQFEYVKDEFPHLLQCADIVISRSGANSIFELLALKKPNLLIPLSKKVSRGDQILNSEEFVKKGFSKSLSTDHITDKSFVDNINLLYRNKKVFINTMNSSSFSNGTKNVIDIINSHI